jgi:hypothetical protein
MRTPYTVALSLLAGVALGSLAVQGRDVRVAFSKLAIEIPHGSSDAMFAPTRQPPEPGMRHGLEVTVRAR